MIRTVPAGVAAILALAAAASPADAGSTERADFALRLDSHEPGTATGMTIRLRYKAAGDPEGKPSPIRRVIIAAFEGLRFDTTVAPRCAASDAELRALGRAACPPASEVGRGTLTASSGFGPPANPLDGDVTVFNGGDELIELVTFRGTGQTAGIDRLRIEGSTLRGNPPSTPGGPPDGQTAIRDIVLSFLAGPAGAKPFITTPPRCPTDGSWTSRGSFAFADGASTEVTSTQACARPDLRLTRRCIGDGRLRMNLVGDEDAVRDVSFKLDKRLARRDTQAPFEQVLDRGTLARTGADRLRGVVYLAGPGSERVILSRSLPRCGL